MGGKVEDRWVVIWERRSKRARKLPRDALRGEEERVKENLVTASRKTMERLGNKLTAVGCEEKNLVTFEIHRLCSRA